MFMLRHLRVALFLHCYRQFQCATALAAPMSLTATISYVHGVIRILSLSGNATCYERSPKQPSLELSTTDGLLGLLASTCPRWIALAFQTSRDFQFSQKKSCAVVLTSL